MLNNLSVLERILFAILLFLLSLKIQSQSLLPNGNFEHPDPKDIEKPQYWDKPDGLGVQWIAIPPLAIPRKGKAICMDTSISEIDMVKQWKKQGSDWNIPDPKRNPIAATYGLSYYSDPIQIAAGQAYCISFELYSPGEKKGAKVWVRGYAEKEGKKRRIYETVVHCRPQGRDWQKFSQPFHPTLHRKEVTEIRVMFYAYWPAGKYWFDNLEIIPISKEKYEKEKKK
ncbi:MAG: hypothetical protein HUU50_13335 [Candidatus Brocadiae bacterium]|nr:hypothetical protein [Candidatus Brocadiia bacterium]